MKARNYRPSGPPPPEALPKRQRKQKRSSEWVLRHDRTVSTHVPAHAPAFKRAVKAQLADMRRKQAVVSELASAVRALRPASRAKLTSLLVRR